MYEDLDPAIQDQLDSQRLAWRDLLWIDAVDLDGNPASAGFWTDIGLKTITVIDAITRLQVDRDFYGTGTLDAIDPLSMTSDYSVREVQVSLSQVNANVANAVRGYNLRYAAFQLYRGHLAVGTTNFIAPAFPRMVGIINTVQIEDPPENGFGAIHLNLISQMVELTRVNPEKRSNPSQHRRVAGDNFYKDVSVVGLWPQWWGQKKGAVR